MGKAELTGIFFVCRSL